jgi:hypothetical protein
MEMAPVVSSRFSQQHAAPARWGVDDDDDSNAAPLPPKPLIWLKKTLAF